MRSLLLDRGFSEAEFLASGLGVQGQRGAYDRFRDRVMWPIRDAGGEPIGFGARKLSDSDQGPKYLNTPDTPIYHKSQVLYGIDLARRDIAKQQQAVIVEGYTDVMACHLSGVTTAVATCGTAFGSDHVKILRRILMDDDSRQARVIYTFDGDAAGRKAAMKAFSEDQNFVANTYVAIEPHGMDPCDLRLSQGPEAVKNLIDSRIPLFEYVMRSTIAEFDLNTAEGRVAAMRAVAPILSSIKDPALRPEYVRTVAGWLGMPEQTLFAEVTKSPKGNNLSPERPAQQPATSGRDLGKAAIVEREALKCVLQAPTLVGAWFESLEPSVFSVPAAAGVYEACVRAGNPLEYSTAAEWISQVLASAEDDTVKSHIRALAVEPLPLDAPDERYVQAVLARVLELDAGRRIAEIKGSLSRAEGSLDDHAQAQLLSDLLALEKYRRDMLEFAIGDQA